MTRESQRSTFPWLAVLSALTFLGLIRWVNLDLPLDRDEGELATLAWLWRSGAGVPYRDWLHQKPPLAIAMALLGQLWRSDGALGLRLVAWVWSSLTLLTLAFLAYGLAARHSNLDTAESSDQPRRWAWGAAWVYAALASGVRTQALAANTETFLILPSVLAVACWMLPQRAGVWSALAAGSWLGVACLAKPVTLPLLLVLPFLNCSESLSGWRAWGWMSLGVAWPWVLVLWGFAHAQAAADLWRCVISYNMSYVASGASGSLLRAWGLSRWLAPELSAALALTLWGLWRTRRHAAGLALGLWFLAALVGVASGGRYYPHYALLLLAPLALASAVGLAQLPKWAACVGLGAILGGVALSAWPVWSASSAQERSLRLYGVPLLAQGAELGALIAQRSPADSRLFIWGSEAQLYYYSQRIPASRFLYNYPLTGEAPAWANGETEYLNGLRDPRTRVAVLTEPLSLEQPIQRDLIETLENSYWRLPSRPGFIVALRRD